MPGILAEWRRIVNCWSVLRTVRSRPRGSGGLLGERRLLGLAEVVGVVVAAGGHLDDAVQVALPRVGRAGLVAGPN